MRRVAAVLAVVLALGCAAPPSAAQVRSDWEERNIRPELVEEANIPLPPAPRKATLIEFPVSAASDFRFFIDGATLSVGADTVVRYVLVARSPSGAENVSFEGMRCQTGEFRRYASGRPDGSWSGTPGPWRPIEAAAVQRWHKALQREFFCPQSKPILSADEGVRALRDGGHPFSRGLSTGIPLGR